MGCSHSTHVLLKENLLVRHHNRIVPLSLDEFKEVFEDGSCSLYFMDDCTVRQVVEEYHRMTVYEGFAQHVFEWFVNHTLSRMEQGAAFFYDEINIDHIDREGHHLLASALQHPPTHCDDDLLTACRLAYQRLGPVHKIDEDIGYQRIGELFSSEYLAESIAQILQYHYMRWRRCRKEIEPYLKALIKRKMRMV